MPVIGSLKADLEASSAGFEAGLTRARNHLAASASSMQRSLNAIEAGFQRVQAVTATFFGALGGTALLVFARRSLEAVGGIGEMASQLGVSTDALQAYEYAATQAGATVEELQTGLARLTRTIGEAANGEKAAIDAFNRLGVGVLDAAGNLRSTDAVLSDVAEGIARIEDPARRAAAVVDLFGKSGQKLLPLLEGGSAGLAEFARQARSAGAVINAELIRQADDAADQLAAAEHQLKKLGQTAAAFSAPLLLDFLGKLTIALDHLRDFQGLKPLTREGENSVILRTLQQIDELEKKLALLREERDAPFSFPQQGVFDQIAAAEAELERLIAKRDALLKPPPSAPDQPADKPETRNPQSKQEIEAQQALESALRKKVQALRAEAEAEGQSEGVKARLLATAEALEQVRTKGLAGLTAEAELQLALIEEGADYVALLKRQREARDAATKAAAEYADQQWLSLAADAEAGNKLTLLAQQQREEVALLEEQAEAARKSTVGYDALSDSFQVFDRELQIVLRMQSLMLANSGLTEDQAREMATTYVDAAEQLKRANEGVAEQARRANEDAQQFGQVLRGSLTDALFSAKTGADVAREGLMAFLKAIIEVMAIEPVVKSFTSSLRSMYSAGSGGGGMLSGLFSFLSGDPSGTASGGMSTAAAALQVSPGGFANGTPSADPGLAWVGERGRELLAFGGGEQVFRPDQIGGLAGGGQVYIDARGADREGLAQLERTIRQLDASIEPRAVGAVVKAQRRNIPGL